MKTIFKILYIIESLLVFWGLIELINLIPLYQGVKMTDLHGFDRFFFLLYTLAAIAVGYLYGWLCVVVYKLLFLKRKIKWN